MFRKKMILFSALLAPVVAIWIFQITWMRPSDIENYKHLIQKREPLCLSGLQAAHLGAARFAHAFYETGIAENLCNGPCDQDDIN